LKTSLIGFIKILVLDVTWNLWSHN